MKLVPDTIAGRTIAILLSGLVLLHLASIWAYELGVNSEIDLANEARVAERLWSISRAITDAPRERREQLAHSLSGGVLEAHWSTKPLTVAQHGPASAHSVAMRHRLKQLIVGLNEDDLIIGGASEDRHLQSDPHVLLLSLRIVDGSWANYSITRLSGPHTSLHAVVVSTSMMALGVIAISILMLRSVTRPLRQCAEAAQRLYSETNSVPIGTTGPREVRALAVAFNGLQERVKKLIDDRTLTVAAVSHDLKTPLTRLRLRSETLQDDGLRTAIGKDVAEMEQMVDQALDFLRGAQTGEQPRKIDLGSLLESIAAEHEDSGKSVDTKLQGGLVLLGQHFALKRAFGNLVGNAVKYGGAARIRARTEADALVVEIEDEGPGIPEGKREAVFEPFVRLEQSRSRKTGGAGLGLTVAKSIIEAHRGTITLMSPPAGQGLLVRVRLPRTEVSSP